MLRLTTLSTALAAFCIVAGTTSMPAAAQDPVKIGVIAPFNTPAGEGLLNAAKMAAEEINSAGGIGGAPIELVIANDEYKPDVGANAYKRLALSDKVVAVVGTASSGVAMAISDQMVRYKVPMIATGAATTQLSDRVASDYKKYKYLFRVMHTSDDMALALGDWAINFLYKEKQYGKVGLLVEDALWTKGVVDTLKKELDKAGVTVVIEEKFDHETKDFKPSIAKIANTDIDYILDISSQVDGAIYAKQWAEVEGPPMSGVNASGTSSRFWNDAGGKPVSHANLIQGSYRAALTPKTIDWFDRYVETWNVSPDYTSGYTYDTIYILKEAIERANSTKADDLVAALEETDYVGVAARWVFEDNHNGRFGPGYRVMGMFQWREDGSREVIWPPEVKTGEFMLPPWHKQ
ncbi:MAG: ABC transporter substrate-binding protein [Castellaniella sp.]